MEDKAKPGARYTVGPMQPVEMETARGFHFAHLLARAIERQNRETVGLIEGLTKLLMDRGVVRDTEWTGTPEHPTPIAPPSPR